MSHFKEFQVLKMNPYGIYVLYLGDSGHKDSEYGTAKDFEAFAGILLGVTSGPHKYKDIGEWKFKDCWAVNGFSVARGKLPKKINEALTEWMKFFEFAEFNIPEIKLEVTEPFKALKVIRYKSRGV